MQIIPTDWQNQLETRYAKVLEVANAFNGPYDALEQDPDYIAASEEFMSHVHDTFGSSEQLDSLMRSTIVFALKEKGYDAVTPEFWEDGKFSRSFSSASAEADEIWVEYKLTFLGLMKAAAALPHNTAPTAFVLTPA